jgi:serine/threonine protein kinase
MSSSSYRTPIEWPTRLVKTFNGINEFQKIKEIGSGAFSTVYSARHKSTGKVYAIKEVKLYH